LADEDEASVSLAELVGYSLIDSNTGKTIGEIAAIDDTTINILFELTDGKLIPASDELIQHIDTKQHQIEINLPEGILEL
jgi:16S rRNA processing protein RimM